MAKIAVSIPDSTFKKLEEDSNTKGMNRSQYVALAIDFYSTGTENYKNEINKLNSQLAERTKEVESLSSEVIPLKEKVHTLENTLEDKDREIGTKATEVFQKDKRIHTLENRIAEMQKKMDSLSKEVLLAKDEGMKAKEELEKARLEAAKYEMAFKSQQADLDFLRGHVSQLTQSISQLSLPPSEEEAKKKGWWQFWK